MWLRSRRRRFVLSVVALALVGASCSSGEDAALDPTSTTTITPAADATTVVADPELEVVEPDSNGRVFDPPVPDPTELPIDDDVRIGVLENGLTYYVRSNDSPGNSVSMRLAVRAGAVHEDPIGTGAAHFLEHMMFNGTERFPGNSLDATLRGIGADIGPDFNAYTSDTETVYVLGLEDTDDRIEVGFDVLVEWASAALIDPEEVRSEALVVREEVRLFDEDGDGIIENAFNEVYSRGTPFEGSNVGGTEESIAAMTPEALASYYDTWYRPDNMAIIAVGDRSLDDLESMIVERFADLEPRAAAVEPPELDDFDLPAEPSVDVVVEPSFGDSFISVDIPVRAWDPNTRGGQELQITEILLGIMIEDRLVEGVDSGRLDLRRGEGGWFTWTRHQPFIGFNVDADDLVEGTEVLMTELEGSLQNPFTSTELERAVDIFQAFQDQRLAEIGTIQDGQIADVLVEHFLGGADIQSIEDSVEMNLEILDSLNVDRVNNHWGWMLTNAAPLVVIVGPDEDRTGTAAEHLEAVERASRAIVAAVDDDLEEIDVLLDRPEAVEEIDRNGLERNPGVELVFDNGMRVLFSPSDIAEGEVSVFTESPGGSAELAASDEVLATVATDVVASSGVGPWEPVQVRRFLSDLNVFGAPYVTERSEGFSGSATGEDLEVLFQLFHLLITEPRVDDVPFAQQVEFARDVTIDSGLDGSFAADLAVSDARLGVESSLPTIEELDEFTPDDALQIYRDRFSSLDEHVIVVVGDVDEDTIIDLARTYVGSLPTPDGDGEPVEDPSPGLIIERLDIGSGTSSGAFRLLSLGEADETLSNRVLAEVTSTILDDRIFSVIREELGATYGGFSSISFDQPGDAVELYLSIDGDPDRIDEIADSVFEELDALSRGAIADSDFDEAVTILTSRYNFINNGFIIESLFDEAYLDDDDQILERGAQLAALNDIDRADVADFIDNLFSDIDRIDVRNVP